MNTLRFYHERVPYYRKRRSGPPGNGDLISPPHRFVNPKGGRTTCVIKQGGFVAIGVAVCSYSDNFSKKKGRALAQFRAEQALEVQQHLLPPPDF